MQNPTLAIQLARQADLVITEHGVPAFVLSRILHPAKLAESRAAIQQEIEERVPDDLLALIGIAKGAPTDLRTNPHYLEERTKDAE